MSDDYVTDQMKKAFGNFLTSDQSYTLNLFEIFVISVPQLHVPLSSVNSDLSKLFYHNAVRLVKQ